MATLATTNIKHASSSSNNIVLNSDGTSYIPGHIIQVVNATTTTKVSNTTTTFVDSGLSGTITPSSTSSKILVLICQATNVRMTGAVGWGYQILRGSTVIQQAGAIDANGLPIQIYIGNMASSVDFYFHHPMQILDSPSTTSAVTYKTQQRLAVSGNSREFVSQPQSTGTINGISRMTLMEVAA